MTATLLMPLGVTWSERADEVLAGEDEPDGLLRKGAAASVSLM